MGGGKFNSDNIATQVLKALNELLFRPHAYTSDTLPMEDGGWGQLFTLDSSELSVTFKVIYRVLDFFLL